MNEPARIGVDIGGTFTDVVLKTDAGRIAWVKVSSTPNAPEMAVMAGVQQAMESAGLEAGDIVSILHGTTVGSNAILQRQGGKCGLITTRGFRDVLEIGRLRTPGMFDLQWDKPEPLIPRFLRREVQERIGADGHVMDPLNTSELLELGAFFAEQDVQSIALCFLNSYRNPDHEKAAAAILEQVYPDIAVTASVSVLPEQHEYERTSTTVVNAYILPVMRDYLRSLQTALRSIGIHAPLFVSNSNGGLARASIAQEKPVFFVSSGRAAGVAGAAHLGNQIGERELVAFDMGGTTASASFISGGKLTRTTEYEFRAGISTPSRFIKAGGYLMRVPTVDIAEIGNGAGSIAYVDSGGLICVGPISAGAEPGPACYGSGGLRPTVTDANLVLGYLPGELAGGARNLDVGLAQAAIERDVAKPLGLAVEDAAFGIRTIANANMARAIQAVTVERGIDARDLTLLAYGGSGPNHACDLARSLSIPKVLFPPAPGVFTAMGMLSGSVEHFFIHGYLRSYGQADEASLAEICEKLRADAVRELAAEGYPPDEIGLRFDIDLRFEGQDSELHIPFDPQEISREFRDLRSRFLAQYKDMYGYVSEDEMELVNVRLTATGLNAHHDEPIEMKISAAQGSQPPGNRPVYFARGEERIDAPVLRRDTFVGEMSGPFALESDDTTIIIPPGANARVDSTSNILVTFHD